MRCAMLGDQLAKSGVDNGWNVRKGRGNCCFVVSDTKSLVICLLLDQACRPKLHLTPILPKLGWSQTLSGDPLIACIR